MISRLTNGVKNKKERNKEILNQNIVLLFENVTIGCSTKQTCRIAYFRDTNAAVTESMRSPRARRTVRRKENSRPRPHPLNRDFRRITGTNPTEAFARFAQPEVLRGLDLHAVPSSDATSHK